MGLVPKSKFPNGVRCGVVLDVPKDLFQVFRNVRQIIDGICEANALF